MRDIIYKIIEEASHSNWDIFREHYENLTFEELKFVNNEFYKMYPLQANFNLDMFCEILNICYHINDSNSLNILELGPSQGHLAKATIEKYDVMIESWIGYEMAETAIEKCVVNSHKYSQIVLNDYFHNLTLPEFDMFVSTHTLEHMNIEELELTIENIINARFIMIELPRLDMMETSWDGYGGSHILLTTENEIKDIIARRGYKVLYDKEYFRYWWVAAWEKE